MNQEERISALEKRIADLENPRFLNQNLANLLSQAGFMRLREELRFHNVSGREFIELIVDAASRLYGIDATLGSDYRPFEINGNFIEWGGFLDNGNTVYLYSTGELPAPLSSALPYTVTNSSGGRFRLTQGGSPVTITGKGTGQHYFTVL